MTAEHHHPEQTQNARDYIFARIGELSSLPEAQRSLLFGLQEQLGTPFRDWNLLDAIIVPGANMVFDQRTGKWKFKTIVNGDQGRQFSGGPSRILAAQQIAEEGFTGAFVVTGGTQTGPDGEKASRADILAQEIQRKIPGGKVIPIGADGSGNTLGNVENTVNFLQRNGNLVEQGRIGLLTNDPHITRASLMFLRNPFFSDEGIELRPVVVEDVLKRRSPLYTSWINAISGLDDYTAYLDLEAQGIIDLFSEKYTPRSY